MIDWTAVILAIIGIVAIALQGYIAYKARVVVTAATATALNVEKIHVATNSERDKMLQEVAGLKEEIRALAVLNAGLHAQLKPKRK